jgi:hypothetical protein
LLSGKEEFEVDDMNDANTAIPMRPIASLADLYAASQLNKRSSLRKLLSAADVRSNIMNWEEESKENYHMQTSVAKIYKFFISKIAVLICGPAAQVSISKSVAKFSDQSQHVLTLPLIHTIVRSKKSKTEQRMARAYLCGSHRREEIAQLKDLDGDFTLGTHEFQQGVKDFKKVTSGQCLSRINRSIERFNRTTANLAISFILSPDNVCFTSWGTKTLIVDGVARGFPLVMRKMSRTHIYENYVKSVTTRNPEEQQLKRSSFLNVVSALTHCDAKLRKAVDYVTGFLINDNFAVIYKLIDAYFDRGEEKRELLREVESAHKYLKYGFNGDNDDCIAHRVSFALGGEDEPIDATATCSNCRHLFFIFQYLKNFILNSTLPQHSALTALDGCQMKAQLFMGHRLRVLNQQTAIRKMHTEMERNCLHNGFSNECVVLLDYKMKFEPVYFREKTVDHYGKRGISWHGSMITFYSSVCVDGVQTAVPNKFYMDHVVENESKQDVTSVISILEAVVIAIKKLFPHITTVFLQSDNASCYQNTVLLMLIPYLGFAHSLCIRRYIHTETQDGKSVLDAHFARSTQVVYEHCKAGKNCSI